MLHRAHGGTGGRRAGAAAARAQGGAAAGPLAAASGGGEAADAPGDAHTSYHMQPVGDGALYVRRSRPRVLMLHTGGTLGMNPIESFDAEADGSVHIKEGTGGVYAPGLQGGTVLQDLLEQVPELEAFAEFDVKVVFNRDSCRVGPQDWISLAKTLDSNRDEYDAFVIVHGTDTLSYTAAALSLMLAGFRKPVVLTGSQLPLALPRSDARQNLLDSIACATVGVSICPNTGLPLQLQEVAVCFGGRLMRGNRTRKVHTSSYTAFESPNYSHLAQLGVELEWSSSALLRPTDILYQPRFKLNPNVLRVPIVPGLDPYKAYGDLSSRGIRGVVLEAFGVGNMPDEEELGWLPWLMEQRRKGLLVYLTSQCLAGTLHPELYRSGSVALDMGVENGRYMTPECAVVKMMLCLEYPVIPLNQPIAGEL